MRQLVEATTGTTMSESGDIDLLDGDRWKSQLEQLPEANTSSRRFAANTASPWAFDSSLPLGRFGGTGGLAGRRGSDEVLEQGLEDLDESLMDSPQSGPLRLRRVEFCWHWGDWKTRTLSLSHC